MRLTITSVDHAPTDLADQVPLSVALIRPLASSDPRRAGSWLAEFDHAVTWVSEGDVATTVTHAVLWPRWKDTRIGAGAKSLGVGIAYVADDSLLQDEALDLAKVHFVAIGIVRDAAVA
jgi:hypothetical protein